MHQVQGMEARDYRPRRFGSRIGTSHQLFGSTRIEVMIQLYAALIYCVGTCSPSYPPPDGLVLYGSLAACQKSIAADDNMLNGAGIVDGNGRPIKGAKFIEHCARIYVDQSFWKAVGIR